MNPRPLASPWVLMLALTCTTACEPNRASEHPAPETETEHAVVELPADYLEHRYAVPVSELDPTRGAAAPAVTLVLFMRYGTPKYATVARDVEKLLNLHGNRLRVVIKPYTRSPEPASRYAVQAVLAAARQGRGWAMHGQLLVREGKQPLERELAMALAAKIGVPDLEVFGRDIDNQTLLDANLELANRLSVSKYSPVFINGTNSVYEGAEQLTAAYERELLRAEALLDDGVPARALYPSLLAGAPGERVPLIPFEPPFDAQPLASELLDSGTRVEIFEHGDGTMVESGMILSFSFKGYSTLTGDQVMGSREGPSRLLITPDPSDPVANELIGALTGQRVGSQLRMTLSHEFLAAQDNPPPKLTEIGDLVMTVELLEVQARPKLATRDAFEGEPIGARTEDDGLVITDYSAGHGRSAKEGDSVEVHYTMELENGTELDSSHKRPDGLVGVAGGPGLIKGFSLGLVGVREGMLRKIVVPPELGYGSADRGKIPSSSTLIFRIQVIEVRDAEAEPADEP